MPGLDNAIFANTVQALQKILDDHGYMLLVACNEYDLDVEVRLTKNLIERGVDGLVLVGTEHLPELFNLINGFRIPYVLTWAYDETGRLPCVGFDNRKATSRITEYLIELGHAEFAVISGITKGNERVRGRLAGVRETLESHGLSLTRDRVVEASFSYENGRAALRKFMSGRRRPTAVVCLNDVFAIGAMAECNEMGLKVPYDVSVTGCEDLEVASVVTPALTTVHFPTIELGQYAGAQIIARLAGQDFPMQQVFPADLVIRASAGPPRKNHRAAKSSAPAPGTL